MFLGRFGGNVFSRFQVLDWLFAHGEYQYVEAVYPTGYISSTTNLPTYQSTPVPAAMLGLGVYTNLGPARLQLLALYNFLYDPNNLFDTNRSPLVLRGGIGFGF